MAYVTDGLGNELFRVRNSKQGFVLFMEVFN